MKYISTDKAPAAIGPYSQAIEVNGFLFASGQVPLCPKTGEVVGTTIEEQAKIEAEALTQWLQTAPAEAIDGIAAKVMELQQIKQQEYEN